MGRIIVEAYVIPRGERGHIIPYYTSIQECGRPSGPVVAVDPFTPLNNMQ